MVDSNKVWFLSYLFNLETQFLFMKNLLLITTFSLLLFTTIAVGQATDSSNFYALGGVYFMNFKNINSSLNKHNLPEINNIHFYYGMGGNTYLGKVQIGGEGFHFSSRKTKKNNVQLKSQGGAGYFYTGYQVIGKERFYFTPRLGIGGGGVEIQLNSKTSTTFVDFLQSNYSNNLTTRSVIIHSGFKAGFVIGKNLDFNFDLGYNYGFNNKWDVEYGKLSETISDRIGGLFSQISVVYSLR